MRKLLDVGWRGEAAQIAQEPAPVALITVKELAALHQRLAEVDLEPAREAYEALILRIRRDSIMFSDRRAVRGLKLVAGAALLREASAAEPRDLWPMRHTWMREDDRPALVAAVDAACGEEPKHRRAVDVSPEALRARLQTLEAQLGTLSSEAGIYQHLRALGALLRDARRLSPSDPDLVAAIDSAIDAAQRRLQELEGAYV